MNLHVNSILIGKIEGEWNISIKISYSLRIHIQIDFLADQMIFTEGY